MSETKTTYDQGFSGTSIYPVEPNADWTIFLARLYGDERLGFWSDQPRQAFLDYARSRFLIAANAGEELQTIQDELMRMVSAAKS